MIGTAVGIVMASDQLTAQQGFTLLATASQNTNSKLRDIATRVVDTGALPLRTTMIDDLIIRVAEPAPESPQRNPSVRQQPHRLLRKGAARPAVCSTGRAFGVPLNPGDREWNPSRALFPRRIDINLGT